MTPLLMLLVLAATSLAPNVMQPATLDPGQVHDYELRLARGQSADVVVRQKGVDVVVEVRTPKGTLIAAVDGPTGRGGEEQVEIVAAEAGAYAIRVRPFSPREPAGAYEIEVKAVRNAAATRALLARRKAARDEATAWLRVRSGTIDELARRARVVGLGEASHGSRELNDARLALTRQLVEQHGYRIVAVEASASGLDVLAPYVAGGAAQPAAEGSGWIGARAQRELIAFLRGWNLAHPNDRVRLVGLDAQDNAPAREAVRALVQQAYGDELRARWAEVEKGLAKADEQAAIFADSSVTPEARQLLFELRARFDLDAPILRARHGDAFTAAVEGVRILAEFADFNSNGQRSRDWSMAARLLRALEEAGPASKAVFWAHNAHVATARREVTGTLLRSTLGCGYAPVAVTFGAGSFVAQVPGETRLAVSELPQAADESIESVFAPLGASTVTWPCGVDPASAPTWLREPHPMHWIGAIWMPGDLPAAATRPFDLLHDFDGVVYVPRVTAEKP
jgi:erythromycin esterase